MCRPAETGYYGEKGMLHISEEPLTAADRKILGELEATGATQLDLYYTRKELHNLEKKIDIFEDNRAKNFTELQELLDEHFRNHKAVLDDISSFKQEMKSAMYIPVKNGHERLASIGEISLINYQSLKLYRDVNRVYGAIKDHRVLAIILTLLIIFFSKDIGEFIGFAVHWIISLRDFIIPN